MSKWQKTVFVCMNFLVLGLPFHASAQTYECPVKIAISSISATQIPASWTFSSQPGNSELVGAGFSFGPPSGMGFLKPSDIKKRGDVKVISWDLDGNSPEGKWLYCSYQSGLIYLAQKLPDSVSACTVSYATSKVGSARIRGIDCK